MRPILAFVMLLLGLSSAAPEPEYDLPAANAYRFAGGSDASSLMEIEISTAKADRIIVAALSGAGLIDELEWAELQLSSAEPAAQPADFMREPDSLGELCNALLTAAQDNDLPVAFFANLIWQESGLRDDVVSPKGALGIAQFMPETAAESGLDNPFDPLQAIPASARMLRELRLQFGNLGFAAAAYNAGPRRVSEWLERRRGLPRETRGYVMHVTGRSVEQWQTTPPDDTALRFVHPLPCRDLPAFAELEQAQAEQAQLARAQIQRMQALTRQAHAREKIATAGHNRRKRLAARKHPHAHHRLETSRAAERQRQRGRYEAEQHNRHLPREKHNSV